MKITVFLIPKNKILQPNQDTPEYIFSFYTAEEKQKYENDLSICEQNGWINDYDHGSMPALDVATNKFTMEFVGNNVQAFIDYFIVERQNFKPIKDYFDAHPEEGTTGYTITN